MESPPPVSDAPVPGSSAPPAPRWPAPCAPPAGAPPTSAPPPGSSRRHVRTPAGSARIAPLWLSCSPNRVSFRALTPETRYTVSGLQVGPNQSIERGQFRVAKSKVKHKCNGINAEEREAPSTQRLRVSLDAKLTSGMIAEANSLIESGADVPSELLQTALNFCKAPSEAFGFDLEHGATTGTGELRIGLKPTDALVKFLAALRARDGEFNTAV